MIANRLDLSRSHVVGVSREGFVAEQFVRRCQDRLLTLARFGPPARCSSRCTRRCRALPPRRPGGLRPVRAPQVREDLRRGVRPVDGTRAPRGDAAPVPRTPCRPGLQPDRSRRRRIGSLRLATTIAAVARHPHAHAPRAGRRGPREFADTAERDLFDPAGHLGASDPGAGHLVYLEEPDVFWPALRAFMTATRTDCPSPAASTG